MLQSYIKNGKRNPVDPIKDLFKNVHKHFFAKTFLSKKNKKKRNVSFQIICFFIKKNLFSILDQFFRKKWGGYFFSFL
jgi:hypothetical protein